MLKYLIKRLFHGIPVIWGVLTISFIISYIIPGDPVLALVGDFYNEATLTKLRAELGLDQSIFTQYFTYLKNTLSGDLGLSFQTKSPVSSLIIEKLGITFTLAFFATIFASILGIIFGLVSAIRFHSIFDRVFIFISLIGISAPVFWVALLLIFWVGVEWKLLPPTGYGSWIFYILPIIALGTRSLAMIARNTRAFMLEILKKGKVFLIDRGDLSKDVKDENIPIFQRKLFKLKKKFKNKKIFVATNLLESMLENNYPNRGEANDIYNSLEMGAEGLVLAAETAVGKYPKDAVIFLKKMIQVFKKNNY